MAIIGTRKRTLAYIEERKHMKIIGFESSCDETAVSVLEADADGKLHILSNAVASQVETHRLYGGVVPEIAGRAHIEAISALTREALSCASTAPSELAAVAVTSHPGLIGALLVALGFAKSFAAQNDLPLVSVDHIKGHVAASYLMDTPPKPPFVALVVSGGHTSLYFVEDHTTFRRIGESRDDAIGEAFDKVGRIVGLPYPAGAAFDRLAKDGFVRATGKEEGYFAAFPKCETYKNPYYKFPSAALADGSLDFSFSGMKTAAINLLHRFEQTGTPLEGDLFAAAYTYAAVTSVVKKVDAALSRYEGASLVVAGGVAANSHLRGALSALCAKKKREIFLPPLSLCGDNGAMIAAQGYYEFLAGNVADSTLNACAADDIP